MKKKQGKEKAPVGYDTQPGATRSKATVPQKSLEVKSNGHGWFKTTRNPDWPELMRSNENAFKVAFIIAFRARWNPKAFNPHGLELGEAIVDYPNWGLSEGQFRRGMDALKAWGFATSRTTNRGTIARLVNTELFCVVALFCNEQNDEPTEDQTTSQPTSQPKTNEEVIIKERKNEGDDDDWGTRARVKVTSENFGPEASKKKFKELTHSLGINGQSDKLWGHFVAINWDIEHIDHPIPYLLKCAKNLPSGKAQARIERVPVTGGAR
jgi:hypothetical protein